MDEFEMNPGRSYWVDRVFVGWNPKHTFEGKRTRLGVDRKAR
jgi:hypothetical protein